MTTEQPNNVLDSHPYLRQTITLISDKWIVAVLYILSFGTKRYGEIEREIGSISQRMLTRTLQDLERNGFVHRQAYPAVPPIVEYSLTPLGVSLSEVTKNLCDWSIENFDRVEEARKSFDRAKNQ